MAELETQQEPADMMSLNDALAKMRETAAAGNGAEIGPVLLARLIEHIDGLRADRKRLASAPVAIVDTRDALGFCAPTETDFQPLYDLRGRRVALVTIDGYGTDR